MPDKFRVTQEEIFYSGMPEPRTIFDGGAALIVPFSVTKTDLWVGGAEPSRDLLIALALIASTDKKTFPREGGEAVAVPGDYLSVQKQRALRLGKHSLSLGWKTLQTPKIDKLRQSQKVEGVN